MARRGKPDMRLAVGSGAVLVLLAAMAVDTKVVKIGSAEDVQAGVFSAATYGKAQFPKVQSAIEGRAVDAAVLAAALAQDPALAETQYSVPAPAGPEYSVKFTGKLGKQDSGVYDVVIPGVPETIHVSVQTGPAINGTDLRDAAGLIKFGDFSNQIDYQNAGSALNSEMKQEVLSKIDAADLTGKTISVVGAFELSDPAEWVVTPVKLTVQ
jgi:predicted lipoprotein